MNVEEAVKRIIANVAEVGEDSITHETHFAEDLEMDSLDAIEAMVQIESEFNVDLLESSIERISTFGDLMRELMNLLDSRAGSRRIPDDT
jgi:acyl carrier protein